MDTQFIKDFICAYIIKMGKALGVVALVVTMLFVFAMCIMNSWFLIPTALVIVSIFIGASAYDTAESRRRYRERYKEHMKEAQESIDKYKENLENARALLALVDGVEGKEEQAKVLRGDVSFYEHQVEYHTEEYKRYLNVYKESGGKVKDDETIL